MSASELDNWQPFIVCHPLRLRSSARFTQGQFDFGKRESSYFTYYWGPPPHGGPSQ